MISVDEVKFLLNVWDTFDFDNDEVFCTLTDKQRKLLCVLNEDVEKFVATYIEKEVA